MDLVWLIPALPVAGFVLLVVFGRRLGDPLAGIVATLAVGASFLVTCKVFLDLRSMPVAGRSFTQTLWVWMPSGSFHVDFGLLFEMAVPRPWTTSPSSRDGRLAAIGTVSR